MKIFDWLDRRTRLINAFTFFLAVVLVCLGDWVGWLLLAWLIFGLWWWCHNHAFKFEIIVIVDNDDGTETKKTYSLKHRWED